MSSVPFKILIAQATLDDLRERLSKTRWPEEVQGVGWDYGTNLAYLRGLIDYWRNEFDWRQQEEVLNRFAHFRADVDGFGLHFIHERGRGKAPFPLLLLHGYPDSFLRFLKLIPLLTDPATHGGDAADAFDIIVPSLPGYGFSDQPHERGFNSKRMASLFARLMTDTLGYAQFGAHGGDWGSVVTEQLALHCPTSLLALHLTNVPWAHAFQKPAGLTAAETKYLAENEQWVQTEGAYALIQSTKPQSLTFGMNDSPAGLAAWIVEKFRAWSDCEGDVERRFTKDEMLTNLTLYWATETISSASRLYYEEQQAMSPSNAGGYVEAPTAFAMFPKDISHPPREWAERFFNVVRWTQMPRGGHFTAMEEPELLAEDIRAFFRSMR